MPAPNPHASAAAFTELGISLDIDSTPGTVPVPLLIQAPIMASNASTQAHVTTCHSPRSGMGVITELTPQGEGAGSSP